MSDATGSFTDSYDYEAFGEVLAQSGNTENSYLFTGEPYDEGLDQYYLRARYYDQQFGRFTQMDTWMGRSQDPVTLNKYLYANADPVNYTDPTGHFGLASVGVANNIRYNLTTLQIDTGLSILDAALSSEDEAVNNLLLGVLAQGSSGSIRLFRLLSKKFKANGGNQVEAVAGSINLMGPNDEFRKRFERSGKSINGFFDIVAHGTSTRVQYNEKLISANELVRILASKGAGYKGGDIRLVSCSTGACPIGDVHGIAQALANKLRVTVKAPTDLVWIFKDGKMTVGSNHWTNSGKWVDFKPM